MAMFDLSEEEQAVVEQLRRLKAMQRRADAQEQAKPQTDKTLDGGEVLP